MQGDGNAERCANYAKEVRDYMLDVVVDVELMCYKTLAETAKDPHDFEFLRSPKAIKASLIAMLNYLNKVNDLLVAREYNETNQLFRNIKLMTEHSEICPLLRLSKYLYDIVTRIDRNELNVFSEEGLKTSLHEQFEGELKMMIRNITDDLAQHLAQSKCTVVHPSQMDAGKPLYDTETIKKLTEKLQ